jgi:hypothetical protein
MIAAKKAASGTGIQNLADAETCFQFLNNTTPLLTILGNGNSTLSGNLNLLTAAFSTYIIITNNKSPNPEVAAIRTTQGTSVFDVGVNGHTAGQLLTGSLAFAACLNMAQAQAMQFGTNDTVRMTIKSTGIINLANCPEYANNAAAMCLLSAGDLFKLPADGSGNAVVCQAH